MGHIIIDKERGMLEKQRFTHNAQFQLICIVHVVKFKLCSCWSSNLHLCYLFL